MPISEPLAVTVPSSAPIGEAQDTYCKQQPSGKFLNKYINHLVIGKFSNPLSHYQAIKVQAFPAGESPFIGELEDSYQSKPG